MTILFLQGTSEICLDRKQCLGLMGDKKDDNEADHEAKVAAIAVVCLSHPLVI